ncbi:MAG: exodeoxyribonuclease VII large subunit, partial [Chthoniobacteraceae bacterium]|nr:exodeoxyribonuclease VII large subunit [Chthoniobacteraceae bacterium]
WRRGRNESFFQKIRGFLRNLRIPPLPFLGFLLIGEPGHAPDPILSVTEVTRAVRELVEGALGEIWVEGEVSNLRKQASGHQYFTLKDDRCQLACVLFHRPGLRHASLALEEGQLVHVRGRMTVYEARGQYQLVVSLVQAAGAGLLAAKFEALKRKLAAEGLFDTARKRALPRFPRAVGIVTSPTGAAIADMLNILHRRAPWMQILINPVRVQGAGAGEELAAAVAEFATGELPPVDVIIVGRGGGSAEDLWEFNDEGLARAIAASPIPVVSAVGHEIDFTIADFVADLRAPTPSAAAELIAPDSAALALRLEQCGALMERTLRDTLRHARTRLELVRQSPLFREPKARLQELAQRIDDASERLARVAADTLSARRQRLDAAASGLREHRPDQLLQIRRQTLDALGERFQRGSRQRLAALQTRLERTANLLRVLAPESTLARGYSITRTEGGAIVRSTAQAPAGTGLVTQLADGEVRSRVE